MRPLRQAAFRRELPKSLRKPHWTPVAMLASLALIAAAIAVAGCGSSSTQDATTNGTASAERPAADAHSSSDSHSGQAHLDDRSPSSPSAYDGSPKPSAESIMRKMFAVYRSAQQYSDQAVVRLEYQQQGQRQQDEARFSVHLQRPNRLKLDVYQVQVACDGQFLRARIDDPLSENMDGQFVQRQAPATLLLDELEGDPIMHAFLSAGLAGFPFQLQMLLDDQRLEDMLGDDATLSRLSDQQLGDRSCWRVQLGIGQRSLEFWIDRQENLLRRLIFPTQDLFGGEAPADTQLVADFTNATLTPTGNDFSLPQPANSKQVRYFIQPPLRLPSEQIGQRPADFQFTSVDGTAGFSSAQLQGKVTVIVWFRDHAACQYTLQDVDRVRLTLPADQRTQFLAVCSDPRSLTGDQALSRLVQQWNVGIPVLRDLNADGQRVFQVDELPTLIVLDQNGVLQIYERRFNPQLAEQLKVAIDRLLAGENLAQEIRSRVAAEQARYESELQEGAPAMTVRPQLTSVSQPNRIKVSPAWRNQEIKSPGNILVVPDSSRREPKILVLEGTDTIVRLDRSGNLLRRHPLPSGRGHAYTYLRTALDAAGHRYFVASAVYGPQVAVLNDQLELLGMFPADVQPSSPGINDVNFADLDQDGQPELLVAFSGTGGVQAVSLSGQRIWSHTVGREAIGVIAVPRTAATAGPEVLVAQGDQQLVGLNRSGLPAGDVTLAKPVFRLFPSADGRSGSSFCALTADQQGNLGLFGLDPQWQQLWFQPLPRGAFRGQIQFVTSGPVFAPDASDWIIAAPDGTIFFQSQDGTQQDQFGLGTYPTGLACATWDGQSWLLVAHQEGVMAMQIESIQSPRTANRPSDQ